MSVGDYGSNRQAVRGVTFLVTDIPRSQGILSAIGFNLDLLFVFAQHALLGPWNCGAFGCWCPGMKEGCSGENVLERER